MSVGTGVAAIRAERIAMEEQVVTKVPAVEYVPPVIRSRQGSGVATCGPVAKPTGSILEEAHALTHGPRQADYGHPLDNYAQTAALASALLVNKLKEPITAHEMALVMVCVKLSRETNQPKRDNRVDGAGYFWVADACLEEAARRATTTQQGDSKK